MKDQRRLAELMERMTSGDNAAIFLLVDEFYPSMRAAVRAHFRMFNVLDPPEDDVHGLVLDTAMMLQHVGRGWRPAGGGSPWHWAWHRVHQIVGHWIDLHHDALELSYDDPRDPEWSIGTEPDMDAVVTVLASGSSTVALLDEALRRVCSDRDRSIVFEVATQRVLADPAAAETVATAYGMKPDAVRQVLSRSLRRLRSLSETEDRFAPLADLPLVAA